MVTAAAAPGGEQLWRPESAERETESAYWEQAEVRLFDNEALTDNEIV